MTEGGPRPVLWAKLSVRHTKKTCLASCAFPLIAMVLLVALKLFEFDTPTQADYFIKSDLRTQLDNARAAAREQFPYSVDGPTARAFRSPEHTLIILLRNTVRSRKGRRGPAHIDTSRPGRNILTPQSLAFLKAAEDEFMRTEGFKRFCLFRADAKDCAGKQRACALPESITNHPFLYGKYARGGARRLCGRRPGAAPVSASQFRSFISNITGGGTVAPKYSIFLGNDFSVQRKATQIMRSFLPFGTPFENSTVPGEKNTDEAMKLAYIKWTDSAAAKVDNRTNDVFHLQVTGDVYSEGKFNSIVTRDLSFAGVSVLLVYLIVWVHTGSMLLANFSILQIMASFPLTYFVYRAIVQVRYFAALQIMTIFLILGIGADDVFVFTDAWKQATVNLGKRSTLVDRMSWAYRRAVKAMGVTSLTTAAAFFVAASSPIMPIATLGIWAGLLVLLQFVLVITMYPCGIIIWHRFWRLRTWRSCLASPHPDDVDPGHEIPDASPRASIETLPTAEIQSSSIGGSIGDRRSGLGSIDTSTKLGSSRSFFGPTPSFFAANPRYVGQSLSFFKRRKQREDEYRPIERFFNGTWTAILNFLRFPILLLGAGLIGGSIYFSTRLEAPREPEGYLPASHPLQVALALKFSAFPVSDRSQNVNVHLIWGLKGINRRGTSKYRPLEIGKAVVDRNFSLKSAAAQRRLLEACEYFENSQNELLNTQRTIEKSTCWIRDFQRWRETVKRQPAFQEYNHDFEIAREVLAFGTYTDPVSRAQPNLAHLTEQRIVFRRDQARIVFTELRFVSRVINTAPYSVMWPEYKRWMNAIALFNAKTSVPGMENAFAVGGFAWMWQITQKALIDNMFLGIGVVFAVALVALSLSTGNWVVSFLALVSIAGILTNLLALVFLFGWTLGITESIGVVIAVGFSFDYVAHVANAYVESRAGSRLDRTRDALTDLGISILAGAFSTLLAGSMLFFTTIIFFVKFGAFVVTTVALSLVWGLVFFPCMLLTVGPTGSSGELVPIFYSVMLCFRCGNKDVGITDGPTIGSDFVGSGSIDGRRTSAVCSTGARNSIVGSLVNSIVGSTGTRTSVGK